MKRYNIKNERHLQLLKRLTCVIVRILSRSGYARLPRTISMVETAILGLVFAALLFKQTAVAEIVGPYTVDEHTLHLWHMDETAVPVADAVTNGTSLTGMDNGATLGNESFNGSKKFGTALGTYVGNPLIAPGSMGQSAFLSALPLENGTGDNVALDYASETGAFTYEAIVRIDFDPMVDYGTDGWGQGRNLYMQIINGDADEGPNRVFQFRLVPVGTLNGNTEPLLEFINLNKGTDIQSMTASIPTNGPDAIRAGNWYHVAVSYTGQPDEDDNIRFYWTLLSPERTAANLVGSGRMKHSLAAGCSPDFAIGQTGRQSPMTTTPNNNFVGLIDEVRISGIARSPNEMQFTGENVIAKSAPQAKSPSETAVAAKPVPSELEGSAQAATTSQPVEILSSSKPRVSPAAATPKKVEVAVAETAPLSEAVVPVAPARYSISAISPVTIVNGAVSRGPSNKRQIAIAFSCRDAGVEASTILDTFKAHHAKASFFLTTEFLFWSPNKMLVRSMLAQGSYVGPQSDNWSSFEKTLSNPQYVQGSQIPSDVQFHLDQLAALGVDPKNCSFFLPTKGQVNSAVASRAHDLGLTVITGTPGTLSFADDTLETSANFASSQAILQNILQYEKRDPNGLNGFILLFHFYPGPWRKDTFYTHFGDLIESLRGRGYEFVRVDELLNGGSPLMTSTTNITQPLSP